MKTILFIMHSMPVGGAERVLVDLLNNIDYSKFQVSLLLKNREGGMLHSVNTNVTILALYGCAKRNLYTRIKGRVLRLLKIDDILECRRTRQICQEHYDTIISFCQGTGHKLHTYLVNRTDNNISWVHSDLAKGNWGLFLFHNSLKAQEEAYNRMNKIVFVSKGAKKSFNKIFTINNHIEQIILYNIVDKKSIEAKSKKMTVVRPEDKMIFINVGRLVDAKQQIRLLQATNILKEKTQNFEMWILGEGPLHGFFQDYIDTNDLHTFVKLMGNQSNPYTYIASSDAFVLSSCQEGYPMVICEALCLSKPIISTDIVGPREILENGKYGLMVNETPKDLASAMMLFMHDLKIRDKYTLLAKERAQAFDVTDFMSAFDNIISD